jgi:osmotically inducible protein OsmC
MSERKADARWTGDLKGGEGTLNLGSGAYEGKYTFRSRFEDGEGGTNPEELIAAAHAGCFSMQVANELDQAGHTVDSVETTAAVTLRQVDGLPTITTIHLSSQVAAPGLDDEQFQRVAEEARGNCIISRALAGPEITLDAELASG